MAARKRKAPKRAKKLGTTSATSRAARLHEIDADVIAAMIDMEAPASPREDWFTAKLNLARGRTEAKASLTEDEAAFFVPWMMWHGVNPANGLTSAERFVRSPRAARLDPNERAWLDAQLVAWLSIWEVVSVEPEVGVSVRDLLTKETRFVHERLGTRGMHPGLRLMGRVVDFEGISVFGGLYPQPLQPPASDPAVKRIRSELDAARRSVAPDVLRKESATVVVIRAWEAAVGAFESHERAPIGDAVAPAHADAAPGPAPFDSAPESFHGHYVFRLGPLAFERGKPASVYVAVDWNGDVTGTLVERSEAKALEALANAAPLGVALGCMPDLAGAGAKHGFEQVPPPKTALHVMASMALTFSLPVSGDGAPKPFPREVVLGLGAAARELSRTRPWMRWTSDDAIDATITFGTRREAAEISVIGQQGDMLGFGIFAPGMVRRVSQDIADPMSTISSALWLETNPPFAADAFRKVFAAPFVPVPIFVNHGHPAMADTNVAATLAATALALAKLSAKTLTATAEILLPKKRRIAVELKAPPCE